MYCHIPENNISMSTIKDDKNKKPKGPLVITKQSSKKAKLGSPDIQFTTINHTYYFRGPQCCLDVLGTEKYKMQLNKKKMNTTRSKTVDVGQW